MNTKFHKICATVKEISVHNGNIQVHQAPFSDGTASNKKKKKKKVNLSTILRNTCMKLNCSIYFHLGFYEMSVRTDRQCSVRSDCSDYFVYKIQVNPIHTILIYGIYYDFMDR